MKKPYITNCKPRCLGKKRIIAGQLYDFRGWITDLRVSTRFNADVRPGWVKLAHRKGAIK